MDRQVMDEITSALHEHGLLDMKANSRSSFSDHKSEVTVESVWKLYKQTQKELGGVKEEHKKKVKELQKYVESVRHLSDERDRLTVEFEKENEALRGELQQLQNYQIEEEKRVAQMCHEENMPDLIGKSHSEQMASLMLIRTNLLGKLDITEKDLRNEDSDLRNRMELAMVEMGSMANKLNEAVMERDRLKREVNQLNQTLSQITSMPVHDVNNMEAKTQIMALENSVEYYAGQIERLTGELDKSKTQARIKEAELLAELREYKGMDDQAKGLDPKMTPRKEQRSKSLGSGILPSSQEQLQIKSRQLITDMEVALHNESQLAAEREKKHQEELSKLEGRIKELEESQLKKEGEQALRISTVDYQELKAQLAESNRQYKVAKAEESEAKEKLCKLQRDFAKLEAQYKQSERQFNTQSEISYGLKQRNDELELELAKSLMEVQSSNENNNKLMVEMRLNEGDMEKNENEMKELREYVSELKRNHEREIRDLKSKKDESALKKSYVSSDSGLVTKLQIQLNEAHTRLEVEKGKRFTAEENLETARLDFESTIKQKEHLSHEIDEMHLQNENLEQQLRLWSGKYEDIQGERLVESMSREQLEDVTNIMKTKLANSMDKSHDFAEKYQNLKNKHKAKIRKIRDLLMMERRTTAEEVEKLELRVMLAESALEQELAWKEKAIDDIRKAEEEQRKAINSEDQARQEAERKNLELFEALSKYKNLSDENKMLQSQLQNLETQKREIEKLVTHDGQKKELNTLLSDKLSMSGRFPKARTKDFSTSKSLNESGFTESSTVELVATSN